MAITEQIIITGKNATGAAFTGASADAKKAAGEITRSFEESNKSLTQTGLALGGLGAGALALIGKSTMLAARVETLGVVMNVVGKNAGYTTEEMAGFEQGVIKMGITTQAARQSLVLLAEAHIDLANSSKLARIAQDAAVIGGINSSEAFQRMIFGIQTLNPLILRHMGILINLEGGYAAFANQAGITSDALTTEQKQQVALNQVMAAGDKITGAYEASMGTAGKQMLSMQRLTEEASLAIGQAFLPLLSDVVVIASDVLKAFNNLSPAAKTLTGELIGVGGAALAASGSLLIMTAKLPGLLSLVANFGFSATNLSMGLLKVTSASAPITNALIGMQSATAAGAITLGIYAGAITAVVFALYRLYEVHKLAQQGVKDTESAWAHFFDELIKGGKSANEIAEETAKKTQLVKGAYEDASVAIKLFIGSEDKLLATSDDLNSALVKTASGYDDYRAAVELIAKALGYTIDAEGNFTTVMVTRLGPVQKVVAANVLLTESEYDAAKAAEEQAKATEEVATSTEKLGGAVVTTSQAFTRHFGTVITASKLTATLTYNQDQLKKAMEATTTAIGGPLVDAHKTYSSTMLDLSIEHQTLINQLAILKQQGYSDTSTKVKDLTTDLLANEQAQRDAAAAVAEATKQFIFEKAALGLNAEGTIILARSFGLLDEQTYAIALGTDRATQNFDRLDGVLGDGIKDTALYGRGMKLFNDLLATLPFDPNRPDLYAKAIGLLADAVADGVVTAKELKDILDVLDGKTVVSTVKINTIYSYTGGRAGTSGAGGEQHGGDYYVTRPTLFLAGEAGPERATFTPGTKTGGSPAAGRYMGRGEGKERAPNIYYITVKDAMAARTLLADMHRQRIQQAEALM